MPKKKEENLTPEPDFPERVGLIDFVRAVCLLWTLLILFLRQLAGVAGITLFSLSLLEAAQTLLAVPVVLVSGISCYFSRDNLKRGVWLLFAGWAVGFFTEWLTPAAPVRFGILTLLGVSCILFYFAGAVLEKIPVFLSVLLFAFLIAVTLSVPAGGFGLPGVFTLSLPDGLTGQPLFLPFGVFAGGADDYPLLPWFFVFLLGTAVGRWRSGRWSDFSVRFGSWAEWLSRHALLLFLALQPVFYGLCLLFLYR